MNRRTFVLTATGIAAVSIPAWYYLKGTAEDAPQMLSMIWDTATIVEVGRKYRELVPAEATEASLNGLIPDKLLREEQILTDFRNDNTILVDGWILSVTEARQCALFSIRNS